jgi:hypothetical protein
LSICGGFFGGVEAARARTRGAHCARRAGFARSGGAWRSWRPWRPSVFCARDAQSRPAFGAASAGACLRSVLAARKAGCIQNRGALGALAGAQALRRGLRRLFEGPADKVGNAIP